ncbi:MAG TPA: tetratricopeptide repeat protein, partial [Longimicrobiales bacterium]|nr:tetratricopeptide repeat protein [Longimicrobiales bacterium]
GMGDEAEAAARRAAELNPSIAKAERNLSLDRYSADRYDELVGEHARPMPVAGALAHYNLGLAFRQRGLYDEATREFGLALERGEDETLVRQAQAEQHLLMGESQQAADLYDALTAERSDSPKLWNERGVASHQLGAADAAATFYRRALELDDAYVLAHNNLGVALAHLGDVEGAAAALRRAMAGRRAPSDIWRNMGLLLSQIGQRDEAVDVFRNAVDRDPDSASAWTGLGVALLEAGSADEAKAALVRAVELDPKVAEARYQLAFALSALGDYPGALAETKRALELDPFFPAPRFRLLIDLQFEEAIVLAPELDTPRRVRAGQAVERFELERGALSRVFAGLETAQPGGDPLEAAKEALARGRLDRAADAVQMALVRGDADPEWPLLQGEIFLRRGLPGEALERFSAVAEAASGAVAGQALRGQARAALMLGHAADALEAATRAVELLSGDADAYRVCARALSALGRYGESAAVLASLVAAGAGDAGTLTELGLAHAGAGDEAKAERAFRQALDEDDGAVAARVALGKLLARTDRVDAAVEQYRAALNVLPGYGEAALPLAEAYGRQDRRQDAVRVLVDLLSVDPYHLDGLTRLGELLHETGRRAQAAVALRRALRIAPDHAGARAALARITGVPTADG